MALLPRGTDDLLLDNLVSVANAFSAAQVVFDSIVGFTAERDLVNGPSAATLKAGPHAIFSIDGENPDARGGSRDQMQQVVTVNCELLVASKEQLTGAGGDQKAMARLLYLKEQIIAATVNLTNHDFGQGVGGVSLKAVRYQFLGVPREESEEYVVGGKLSLDLSFSRALINRTLLDLETVSVTVAKDTSPAGTRWSGLYTLP